MIELASASAGRSQRVRDASEITATCIISIARGAQATPWPVDSVSSKSKLVLQHKSLQRAEFTAVPLRTCTFACRAAIKGGKGGAGPRAGGQAMDPVERIRLQVSRARATKRLDLSTWANRRQGDFLLSRVPRTVRHADTFRAFDISFQTEVFREHSTTIGNVQLFPMFNASLEALLGLAWT